MKRKLAPARLHPGALKAGVVTMVCTIAMTAWDIAKEMTGLEDSDALSPAVSRFLDIAEVLSVAGLAVFAACLFFPLRHMSRQSAEQEQTLSLLHGQFGKVLEQKFSEWALTPAERDVAMLMLKGLNVSEIATARYTAPGTVKAQSTKIFRKVGVRSKPELLSTIIDEFLEGPGGGHTVENGAPVSRAPVGFQPATPEISS